MTSWGHMRTVGSIVAVHMAKDWKLLEKLTASFERVLAPKDAVIKSPDRLKDRDTGKMREVDVSIRYTVGSAPILVTVECRDRSRKDDATWIEQLACKQRSIGANATIAVSARGFGEPAQRKAKSFGIELRHVERVSDEEIAKWFEKLFVHVGYLTYRLKSVLFSWPDDKPPPEMSDKVDIPVDGNAWDAAVLFEGENRTPLIFDDLLKESWEGAEWPTVAEGQLLETFLKVTPEPDKPLFLRHGGKYFPLRMIELEIELGNYRQTTTVESLRQYRDGENLLVYGGHGKVTKGLDEPIEFFVLKKLGADPEVEVLPQRADRGRGTSE
jgi:hypothetical protein